MLKFHWCRFVHVLHRVSGWNLFIGWGNRFSIARPTIRLRDLRRGHLLHRDWCRCVYNLHFLSGGNLFIGHWHNLCSSRPIVRLHNMRSRQILYLDWSNRFVNLFSLSGWLLFERYGYCFPSFLAVRLHYLLCRDVFCYRGRYSFFRVRQLRGRDAPNGRSKRFLAARCFYGLHDLRCRRIRARRRSCLYELPRRYIFNRLHRRDSARRVIGLHYLSGWHLLNRHGRH